MKSRVISLLACMSGVLLAGGIAQGRPTTFTSVATGNWTTPSTWDQNSGYPVAGDTAIIDGETVTITGQQEALSVTVSSGQLKIDGSGSPYAELHFPNSGSPSLSVGVSNGVQLVDNARVKVSKNMNFTGAGSIQGLDDATCEIAINNATLTLQLLVHGELAFVGLGQDGETDILANQGEVRADVAGGTISLAASLEGVTDSGTAGCSTPRWSVDKPSTAAVLQFDAAATSLVAPFRVNGIMNVNANVTTTAGLQFNTGGRININNGASFTFSGNCGNCSPSSPISANATCP